MAEWEYHDAAVERDSRWGDAPHFMIVSPESTGGQIPTVGDGEQFDSSVQELLDLL